MITWIVSITNYKKVVPFLQVKGDDFYETSGALCGNDSPVTYEVISV